MNRRHFLSTCASAAALSPLASIAATRPRSAGKKGCCFTTGKDNGWQDKLRQLNGNWMYSWGWKKPDGFPDNVEFCPMLWSGGSDDKRPEVLAELKAQYEAGRIHSLMGFNEPDQQKQSNMTVERVVELWPELESVGAPLVSPGCVHPDREWMHSFMEQVEKRGLRVDYIAVHSYGGPSAESLVKRLEKLHREFGRPLWITEFAVGDWEAKSVEQNRHSPKQVADFMKKVLPALDRLKFVDRYAWFAAGVNSAPLGTSALFNEDGSLTALGKIYAAHGASRRLAAGRSAS